MAKGQTVGSVGEDALIHQLTRGLNVGSKVLVGPGDDCAVLGTKRQKKPLTLFKTDCVVENVHYLPDTNPAKVGWKAMARAVSDIAAMGGWPVAALATLVLHPDTPLEFARGLYKGFRKAENAFDFSIVGGETSSALKSGVNMISVSMLGNVEPSRCVLRSTAQPGDAVFVTGRLGGSFEKDRHLTFQPRLQQARWLVDHHKPTAMMDLSDGLAKDLPRLAIASGVGFVLDQSSVPCTRGCDVDRALGDGEDYELLFTASPQDAAELVASWKRQFPKLALSQVGEICPASDGERTLDGGWDHFRAT